MADGFAQATRNPALAVVHSAGGTGNGMGTIMTAFLNRSPLVIMAGTQERQMLIGDPYLTNRDPTLTPLPWVKWAYQPFSAAEVPAAMVRAIAIASMPPQGPVYLSVPLDDWAAEVKMETAIRTVSTVVAPDPQRLADFAARVAKAKKIALVYGEEVDYSLAWEPAIALAELLKAPVFAAPLASRATFPANNPLYHGSLPLGQGPVGEVLSNFDLVLVVGAEVFRYYPWAPGPVLRNGTHLLQITNSPHDAGAARVGDSLLSDARLALEGLLALLQNTTTSHAKKSTTSSSGTAQSSASKTSSAAARQSTLSSNTSTLMTAAEAFEVVAMLRKSSDLLVQESTSNVMDLLTAWPIVEQATYFFSASGFLGWGLPAAVGIAMAQTNRTTIAVIGDGSTQYSIQALYTAVQHKAKVIVLVPRNEEYAILKEFEVYQKTPNCRESKTLKLYRDARLTFSFSRHEHTGHQRENHSRRVWDASLLCEDSRGPLPGLPGCTAGRRAGAGGGSDQPEAGDSSGMSWWLRGVAPTLCSRPGLR